MENLLKSFIDAQLLPSIKDNKEFGYLESSSKELSQKISKNKLDIIRYTLAGLNSNLSIESKLFSDTESIIKKSWKTLRNVTDSPNQLIKAVIWESLNLLSKDTINASIIFLTGESFLLASATEDAEKQILIDFFNGLKLKFEKASNDQFKFIPSTSTNNPVIGIPNFEFESASKGFEMELLKASAQNAKDGTALQNANPYNANQGHPWAAEFASRAASSIAKRIDKVGEDVSEMLGESVGSIRKAIQDSFNQLIKDLTLIKHNERMQSDLLWWHHSLYSPSIRKSYRELTIEESIFATAFDLHKQINHLYPIAVEYILQETLLNIYGEISTKPKPVLESLKEIFSGSNRSAIVNNVNANTTENENVKSFLGIAQELAQNTSIGDEEFLCWTGIDATTEISSLDLAIWLFREMQAFRMATTKDKK